MEKKLFKIKYEEAEPIAKEYFIKASGLETDAENHKTLLNEALQVLDNCKSGIDIRSVVVTLDCDHFGNSTIILEGHQYNCTAFDQISSENVVKIYAYLLSLGQCKSGNKNQAEQYYADLWANGFLEAGILKLRDQLYKSEDVAENNYYISDSFGPGRYGMSPERLSTMLSTMDGNIIGICSDEDCDSCKFCGGFFFVLTLEEGNLPSKECRNCIGHEKGCMFCGGKNIIPSKKTCMELLDSYGTPDHVVKHCIAVTETAVKIAEALKEKGIILNLDLLEASALLHDIARVEDNHGVKGAIVLEKCGYHQVAKLVKCHMFYSTNPDKVRITEQDLLCLADRMVKEDKYVGLESRMKYVLDKLIADGIDTSRVLQRLDENRLLKERIEAIIGKTIDDLMK